MRPSVAKARQVIAQEKHAASLEAMQKQLDRIEGKLDKALGISKKKNQSKPVAEAAEPTEPTPEEKA